MVCEYESTVLVTDTVLMDLDFLFLCFIGMKQLFGENKDKPLFFQAALELGGFVPIMG